MSKRDDGRFKKNDTFETLMQWSLEWVCKNFATTPNTNVYFIFLSFNIVLHFHQKLTDILRWDAWNMGKKPTHKFESVGVWTSISQWFFTTFDFREG